MAHGASLRNMSNVTLQRDSEFERVGGEGDEYLKMGGFLFSAMLLKNLAGTTAKTNPKNVLIAVYRLIWHNYNSQVRNVDYLVTLSNQILPTSNTTKYYKCMPTSQKNLYVEQR